MGPRWAWQMHSDISWFSWLHWDISILQGLLGFLLSRVEALPLSPPQSKAKQSRIKQKQNKKQNPHRFSGSHLIQCKHKILSTEQFKERYYYMDLSISSCWDLLASVGNTRIYWVSFIGLECKLLKTKTKNPQLSSQAALHACLWN